MNIEEEISKIWDSTIGVEGVDTGYPKFVKKLQRLIGKEGEEAINGFWKWYVGEVSQSQEVTGHNPKDVVEAYLASLDKDK